jgi:hypothetical protein
MRDAAITDGKASAGEVLAHARELRALAEALGLGPPAVRDDGAVVIHPSDDGYRSANRFASGASRIVGEYVHVITDDVPGAASARRL